MRQDRHCLLCDKPTPMRSRYGEPVHKASAEDRIAANPVEARLGRFASDLQPEHRHDDNQA